MLKLDPHFQYPEGVMPPWMYARVVLGLDPYPWAIEALEAIGQYLPTALLACNGAGKTTNVIAPAVLWFLDSFPNGRIPLTSGSFTQIEHQLFPAMEALRPRVPHLRFNKTEIYTPDGGCCLGFSTDNPGRAEGYHGDDDAPVFYICDESKTISDGIFSAADRCTTQYRLYASSAGQSSGQFYRCFTKERDLFYTIKVTSYDCPHIKPEKRERDLIKYGEDNVIFRSMHLSEFMDVDGKVICLASDLLACLENPPEFEPGDRVLFCDLAAGGDENVAALRNGNRVTIEGAWREDNTVQGARQFVEIFKRLNLFPYEIYADEGGLGVAFCDQIDEELANTDHPRLKNGKINRVNNGARANDPANYVNWGSEAWFEAATAIINKKYILPDDGTFFEQATTRRGIIKTGGKLMAQQKEELPESPDRADAVFGAIHCAPDTEGAITDTESIHLGSNFLSRQWRPRTVSVLR